LEKAIRQLDEFHPQIGCDHPLIGEVHPQIGRIHTQIRRIHPQIEHAQQQVVKWSRQQPGQSKRYRCSQAADNSGLNGAFPWLGTGKSAFNVTEDYQGN
jgi:hypothetical protein